jgi:hypothetical protein
MRHNTQDPIGHPLSNTNAVVRVTSTMGTIVQLLRLVKERRQQEALHLPQSVTGSSPLDAERETSSTSKPNRAIIRTSEEQNTRTSEQPNAQTEGGDANERRTD